MRQVPRYLLIGNGRVAQHIQYYFTQLVLSFTTWQRKQSFAELQQQINDVTHIVLLISDQHQNVLTHPKTALIGPLVRGDPLKEVYGSFVKCYESLK